jgi:PAS domain S-box-containing protein
MNSNEHSSRRFGWILFLLGVALMTAIGVLGYFFLFKQQNATVREVQQDMATIAKLKRDQIVLWRNQQLSNGRWIQEASSVHQDGYNFLYSTNNKSAFETLSNWMSAWVHHQRYDQVFLLDTNLLVRLRLPTAPDLTTKNTYAQLRPILLSNEVQLSDLHLDANTGQASMELMIPLRLNDAGTGKTFPVGMLVFKINPSRFLFPLIQNWPTPSTSAETLLVRRDGNEVLYLNELRHRKDTVLTLRLPLSNPELPAVRAVLGEAGVFEGKDYRGYSVISALQQIPETPWAIVAKVDREEIYAPLRSQAWVAGIMIGALIIAAGLGTTLIWRDRESRYIERELEEQINSEAKLRASEEKYRLLFEQMITGFALHEILYDSAGKPCDYRFVEVNPAFERLTGLKSADISGRKATDIMPDLEPFWIERYGQVVLTGAPVHFEDYNQHLDKHFEVRAFRTAPDRFAVMFQDISARKLADQEREQLNRELAAKNEELESLVYVASHDLRAPLVNIQGFGQRLDKFWTQISANPAAISDVSSRDQTRKALHFIRTSAEKMNALINGLLQVSRMGRVVLNVDTLDINALLQKIIAAQAYQIQKADVQIKVETMPPCHGDANLLNQVFSNLLDNAMKYRDPQRPLQIRFSGERENNRVVYCVADNGQGIPSTHQKKIWEMFHRLNPTGSVPGEGIGLNVVRRIMERHRGQVWVESTPGSGSKFYIALPIALRQTVPKKQP